MSRARWAMGTRRQAPRDRDSAEFSASPICSRFIRSAPWARRCLRAVREGGGPATSDRTAVPSLDDRLGVVCVAMPGQTECGDAWRVAVEGRRISVLLVDGLGHGPDAAAVAATATTSILGARDRVARAGARGARPSHPRQSRRGAIGCRDRRTSALHYVRRRGQCGRSRPLGRRASALRSAEWHRGAHDA